MGAIKSDMTGGTLTLRLDRPPVNALDVATLDELSDRLDAASAEDVQAVVLTGSGPVFSAGADLYRVLGGGGDYVNTGIAALSLASRRCSCSSVPSSQR